MRSRTTSWLLVAVAAASVLIGFGAAVRRSAIPVRLSGEVTAVEALADGPLPDERAHLVTVGGRRVQVDRHVAEALRAGDRLDKPAWSRTLRTPRGDVRLGLSRDAVALPAVYGVVAVLLAVLLGWAGGRSGGRRAGRVSLAGH